MNKRMLTGDRPTGPLHLGHYFGSVANRVKLQSKGYESFIIIADYQVLTDRLDTKNINKNVRELVKDYISLGISSSKSTIFVQSSIHELAELTIVLSMLVNMNRVARNPTVKEEIHSMGLVNNFSLGMFSYPISQAADILLFNADVVPVGEDQLPHIELTREVARKFNREYKRVFRIPKPLLSKVPRMAGLDNSVKMSKSRGNAIFLKDTKEEVFNKINRATTDSGSTIEYDPVNKPNISNLLQLFHLVSGSPVSKLENDYKNSGYKLFKIDLAEAIVNFLIPIQTKRKSISEKQIDLSLKKGNSIAQKEAQAMMKKVRSAMSMDYGL